MKKFCLGLFLAIIGIGIVSLPAYCKTYSNSSYNCKVQYITRSGRDRDKNEFLYETQTLHSSRNGLVCGHEEIDGCDNHTFALFPGGHVWQENPINGHTLYMCDSTGGNAWQVANINDYIPVCSVNDLKGRKLVSMDGINYYCKNVVGSKICIDETHTPLKGTGGAATKSSAICRNGTSVVVPPVDPAPEPEQEKKSCRERRVNMSTEAIACCDTGKAADWKLVSGEYKCVCKNQKNEFKIVNGRGQCVPKQETPVNPVVEPDKPVPPVTKDCPVDAYPSDDNKTCVCNDNNMTYNAGKNSCECPSGTIKTGGVCKCPDPNKELVNGKCEYGDAHWSVQIDGYYSQLHGIIDGLKLNVWRDAEGNFNTARLASDSIAGVVLGTVGGVVTAHLVKKNQLKKGFEDIQCHIGGQSVADYGDGFVVGR